ncbi:MAG TPA: NIPSNAP family protein [Pseudorhodoplanes sp.]|jgi:hypothetical protein|nr:NIPSNAP family protein [Pseudorhodoplanes sp.]
MLIDHRTYRCKPGKLQAYIKLYEEYGKETQVKYLGQPVAHMVAESGTLNTLVHIWAYDSAADREKRRAAMQADPAWQNFLKLSAEAGYLENQTTMLMTPTKVFDFRKPG